MYNNPTQLSYISEFQDPLPHKITYQGNDQSSNNSRLHNRVQVHEAQKGQNPIFVQDNKPVKNQNITEKERRVQFQGQNKSQNVQTFGQLNRKSQVIANDKGSKQPQAQPLEDISIMDWVNGYHCPPPLILDKKIYYNEIQEDRPQQNKQIHQQQTFNLLSISYPDRSSIGVQTDNFYMPMSQEIHRLGHSKSLVPSHFDGGVRLKSTQSDDYPEDFESLEQSQYLPSRGLTKHVSSVSMAQQASQGYMSPKNTSMIQRQKNQLTQQDREIAEQISDIYSDDFDSMSQSASLRRSQSQEKLNSRSQRRSYLQNDQVSESYAQDFESLSQYTNSTSQVPKRK